MRAKRSDLLVESTITLQSPDGPHTGTGILVAPGVALTSAALVAKLSRRGEDVVLVPTTHPITVRRHNDETSYSAHLSTFLPDLDLALLTLPFADHPCVYLDAVSNNNRSKQHLHCFGYPPGDSSGQVCFPEVTGYRSVAGVRRLRLNVPSEVDLTLFTGAALLDEQSGGVCAIVIGAQPVDRVHMVLLTELREYLNRHFSRSDIERLCFDLGFSLDNVPNAPQSGLENLTLEVLRFVDQKGRPN